MQALNSNSKRERDSGGEESVSGKRVKETSPNKPVIVKKEDDPRLETYSKLVEMDLFKCGSDEDCMKDTTASMKLYASESTPVNLILLRLKELMRLGKIKSKIVRFKGSEYDIGIEGENELLPLLNNSVGDYFSSIRSPWQKIQSNDLSAWELRNESIRVLFV